eukprot:8726594-Ditylum_brightwellii.AAC.1
MEVKHLNTLVNDKVKEILKECKNDLHTISAFEELLISLSNESIKSSISNILVEALDSKDNKP